ncbi:MAG: flavodoxin [Lactobacillus sp.]|nr:flavodoxin [Lactobacillus sp.]
MEKMNFDLQADAAKAVQLQRDDALWQHGRGSVSDGQDTNADGQPTCVLTDTANAIVIYFSRSGSTELLAHMIAMQVAADSLEIVVQKPYSQNYQQTLNRANYERLNQHYPALNMQVPNLDQYQTVYLGYPVWAMTLSHPMTAFLKSYGSQLNNKKIVPFMTQGGYGAGDSVQQIQTLLHNQGIHNEIAPSLVIDGNKVNQASSQIRQWLNLVNR